MDRREKLIVLRATAARLPLGEHGDRCLRDLFVELVDALTGEETKEISIALAGARAPAPAPELVGVTGGVKALAPPAGVTRDLPRPAADVPDPAGDGWLAELAAADAKAEADADAAQVATATAAKTKTDPKATPTPPNGGH